MTERPAAPEPIRPDHHFDDFDCGVAVLDHWLKRRALANEVAGASRTFVACEGDRVVGYYSLAAVSVVHDVATPRARRNMPDPIPAVVLGRLAIDRGMHRRGLGASLVRDAVLRVAGAAESIGIRVLLVHALSDEAKRFCLKLGFRESPVEPMTLMVTLAELRQAIEG